MRKLYLSKNFHTRKIGEITVFYKVLSITKKRLEVCILSRNMRNFSQILLATFSFLILVKQIKFFPIKSSDDANKIICNFYIHIDTLHYVKSVRIRSFSGSYFPAFGLNTDQKNYE